MALDTFTYGFYDSLNGDRFYTAEQLCSIFDGLISDGVIRNYGGRFEVSRTDPASMTVQIAPGRAWFNHTWSLNETIGTLTLPAAPRSGTGSRYDAVVLEVDKSVGVRANSIKIISGTVASNPVKPAMTRTDTLNQYPLAYILVNAGVTSVSDSVIEDARSTDACGMSKAIVQVDASVTEISNILSRLDALEAASSNYWTKSQLQFSTADSNTTLNITVNNS